MSEFNISHVSSYDRRALNEIDLLLEQEGLKREKNLDYTCAMYDENYHVIATGSCFHNTLRCFAVSSSHQGEGLLNEILSHLIEIQFQRGNTHFFLYTKLSSAKFFSSLGFYEIARVDDSLVFMENRRNGFETYLSHLKTEQRISFPMKQKKGGTQAAIVMNANPFTLGHLSLIETAVKNYDTLHLFLVSEEASILPFSIRKELVLSGISHIPNIICHDSGPYLISHATFPSYFLKDEASVISNHARLDLAVFLKLAKTLNLSARYIGEEPTSLVTGIYNQTMITELPKSGIQCFVIPRKKNGDTPISASTARMAIHDGDFALLKQLVPKTTYDYFTSARAVPILEKIRQSDSLIHY